MGLARELFGSQRAYFSVVGFDSRGIQLRLAIKGQRQPSKGLLFRDYPFLLEEFEEMFGLVLFLQSWRAPYKILYTSR